MNITKDLINWAEGEYKSSGKETFKEVANHLRELEAQLAAVKKDAERLDFMLKNSAFMVIHHGTRWQCQTQDADENYIVLSGTGCSYMTEREAIDAAIKKVMP